MIRLEIKNGKQTITAVCNKCKCAIKTLNPEDIIVKKPNNPNKIYDSKGKEITRTEHEWNDCKCEHCNHD